MSTYFSSVTYSDNDNGFKRRFVSDAYDKLDLLPFHKVLNRLKFPFSINNRLYIELLIILVKPRRVVAKFNANKYSRNDE